MRTTRLAAAGLLALSALAFVPPASADVGDTTVCSIAHCCPSVDGRGGVVGATVDYASDMAGIACDAAHKEIDIVAGATVASCDATLDYLFGTGCTTTCTCDPPVIDPICCISTAASDASVSMPELSGASIDSITIACFPPPPSSGGVVGDTREYAGTMGYIGCDATLATLGVVLVAADEGCSATGHYLVGQDFCARIVLL